jgi:hypothetical protein
MPSTVNANNMTVVHASSNGTSPAFPDLCKTPTPGGPIPIPYPNIAMSSDTADGASTVKVDGNPIMLKGSNYSMSSGDEAGSAQGVVSNKIKGKAEPVNYSFDIKADGANVFRLADMMLHNEGSNPNTPPAINAQGPIFGMPGTSEQCSKTKKEKKEQAKQGSQWGKSGIIQAHRGGIQSAASAKKVVIYFRQTKSVCGRWIGLHHQPKPHAIIAGTTIKVTDVKAVNDWLHDYFVKMDKAQAGSAISGPPAGGNHWYSRNGADYVGIIGQKKGPGIQPLRANSCPVHEFGYEGKWMTGDYDLYQVLGMGPDCKLVLDGGAEFRALQKLINSNVGWDAIQHGPQAQWVPNQHDRNQGVLPFDMNKLVKGVLKNPTPENINTQVPFHKSRGKMSVIDSPLTVVAGDGVVALDDKQKVVDALICQECDK